MRTNIAKVFAVAHKFLSWASLISAPCSPPQPKKDTLAQSGSTVALA